MSISTKSKKISKSKSKSNSKKNLKVDRKTLKGGAVNQWDMRSIIEGQKLNLPLTLLQIGPRQKPINPIISKTERQQKLKKMLDEVRTGIISVAKVPRVSTYSRVSSVSSVRNPITQYIKPSSVINSQTIFNRLVETQKGSDRGAQAKVRNQLISSLNTHTEAQQKTRQQYNTKKLQQGMQKKIVFKPSTSIKSVTKYPIIRKLRNLFIRPVTKVSHV